MGDEEGGQAGSDSQSRVLDTEGDGPDAELYRRLFANSINGIAVHEIITDGAGDPVDYRFLDVNDTFEEYTDLDAGSIVGERVTDVLPGIEDTEFIETYGRVALEGESTRFKRYSEPLDRYYDISAFPLGDGLFVTTFVDITERQEREKELEEKTDRLDSFARRLAHELRNPLAVISARLTLVRQTGDLSHLDHLERSVSRMERLIDDLLVLADEGSVAIDPDPVALEAAATACWERIRTPDTAIDIRTDARIVADEDRLYQLLENLFRNSVEHGSTSSHPEADDSAEHGSTSSRTQSNDAVEHTGSNITVTVSDLDNGFYVADDGSGIPPETRESMFESGVTDTAHATGLGLTIVREVAQIHGWSVTVTNGTCGGARFEFRGVSFDTDR